MVFKWGEEVHLDSDQFSRNQRFYVCCLSGSIDSGQTWIAAFSSVLIIFGNSSYIRYFAHKSNSTGNNYGVCLVGYHVYDVYICNSVATIKYKVVLYSTS